MVKLIDCDRTNLSEGDWYLWFNKSDQTWHIGQYTTHEGEPAMNLDGGGITDIGWVARKGYRIIQ